MAKDKFPRSFDFALIPGFAGTRAPLRITQFEMLVQTPSVREFETRLRCIRYRVARNLHRHGIDLHRITWFGRFDLVAQLLLKKLKHKVLRSYSQADEIACSFTALRMTNLMGEIDFELTGCHLENEVDSGRVF